jgi:hypothetical protein
VTLVPFDTRTGINFGARPLPATIEGAAWYDVDADGVWDQPDETGIAGWTVFLDANSNSLLDVSERWTATDAEGRYSFTGLAAATYEVAAVERHGWAQSHPAQFGSHTISVGPGETESDAEFGFRAAAEIHGTQWEDRNGDGDRGADEPGLAGWTIFFDINQNGVRDLVSGEISEVEANNTLAAAQNVDAAPWSLDFHQNIADSESLPHLSIAGTGDNTFDYYSFTVATAGSRAVFDLDATNFDTELFLYTTDGRFLAGNDDNGDDPGSTSGLDSQLSFTMNAPGTYIIGVARFNSSGPSGGISGATPGPGDRYTLHISLENHAGTRSEAATVSDSEGNYSFTRLTPGTYTVAQMPQAGWQQILPAPPGTHQLSLAPFDIREGVDFANRREIAEIHGITWDDQNGDGVRTSNEPGLTGWTVYIDANQNGVLDVASGQIGDFEPNNTLASAQSVDVAPWSLDFVANIANSESIPHLSIAGTGDGSFDYYSFTVDIAGSAAVFDMDDTNFDTELFLYSSSGTLLGSNDDNGGDPGSTSGLDSRLSFTFANTGTYIIGVGRFSSNGAPGGITGDMPIAGDQYRLHISLENHAGGAAEQLDITDANGNYSFHDLVPGTYLIAQVPQAGWHQTAPASPGTHIVALIPFESRNGIDFGFTTSQPLLAGDYNRNGEVDTADYVVWRKLLGSTVPSFGAGDGTGDGLVNADDHGVWRANFGSTLPSGAGASVSGDVVQATQAASAAPAAAEASLGGAPRAGSRSGRSARQAATVFTEIDAARASSRDLALLAFASQSSRLEQVASESRAIMDDVRPDRWPGSMPSLDEAFASFRPRLRRELAQ